MHSTTKRPWVHGNEGLTVDTDRDIHVPAYVFVLIREEPVEPSTVILAEVFKTLAEPTRLQLVLALTPD